MITSKQILCFLEEWLTSGKARNRVIDIYDNPTKKDLIQALRDAPKSEWEIRFIASAKNNTVYIWDAFKGTHEDGLKVLGLPTDFQETPYLFLGYARVSPSGDTKFVYDEHLYFRLPVSFQSKNGYINYYSDIFSLDWSFVDKYISGFSSGINDLKKEFQKTTGR